VPGSCHRHRTHELPMPRGSHESFPAMCLRFPEAQKRTPGTGAATGRGAGSPRSTAAVSPAHRSQCPAQADPPGRHPPGFTCPYQAGAPPARGAGSDCGGDLVLPGQRAGFVQTSLPAWGLASPASPFPQARVSPGHGHRQGWPPENPIFAFPPVNPWAEECGVTTCVAPLGSDCVWRDAGTSPFCRTIYFLNICGRK